MPDRDAVQRAMLPIPDRPHVGLVTFDAKDPNTTYPPIRPVRPPAGAPNVLVVLVDDVGFGASSAFGGPCETPHFERLGTNGLRYNRFHTTALCAPTRAALLTGRNHHSVGMGGITEIATSAPGNNSLRPNTKAPLAQTLQLNGYSTAQFGKCHEVPVWQASPVGPFDMWPIGSGFEYFYGFIGGEDNQWYPSLYEGTTPVEPPRTPDEGYHLTEDLADHAIGWVRTQKALAPDEPFFMYFAPGATHAPHHVPREWIDRYRGRFAHGWDRQRELILTRQKEAGRRPRRHRADPAPRRDPHLGRDARRAEADPRAPDGDLRRLPLPHRPSRRPATRRDRAARRHGRHPHQSHRRRQRRLRRRHPARHLQRDDQLQRDGRAGEPRVHGRPARPLRRTGLLQPLRRRLGLGHGCTVPVDQAGRLPLGRNPQPAPSCTGPAASTPAASCGRSSATSSTSPRRCSTPPAFPSPPWSTASPRAPSKAPRCSTASTTPTHPSGTTCSTSRCSATAASTSRAGARSPSTARPGYSAPSSYRLSTTTSGSSMTAPRTTASPTTWPRRCPTGSTSCNAYGSSKPPSTASCPSTTAPPNGPTPTSRAAPN